MRKASTVLETCNYSKKERKKKSTTLIYKDNFFNNMTSCSFLKMPVCQGGLLISVAEAYSGTFCVCSIPTKPACCLYNYAEQTLVLISEGEYIRYDHQFRQGQYIQTLSHYSFMLVHPSMVSEVFIYPISPTRLVLANGIVFRHFPTLWDHLYRLTLPT